MSICKDEVRIGVVGLGTVGSGVVTVLAQNSALIAARSQKISLVKVADTDTSKAKSLLTQVGLCNVDVCGDWRELVADNSIDIVVEVIGGVTEARLLITAALTAGKSVVTANKDLLAAHGGELLDLAAQQGVDLFFEASVAGGIPIIQSMKEGFAANRIKRVMGIMNGTTNYILTNMYENGLGFAEALEQAQQLGYAESDPTNDVEGFDAARKIAILASIAFNSRVSDDMVPTEGISGITDWDIRYAEEFGLVIKMLGIAQSDGNSIEVRVHPVMINKSHPLAAVRDSYNAVFVEGDALEKAMLYGRGAGSLPTGSAVVGDIIAASRNIAHNSRNRWGCTCYQQLPVKKLAETSSKYYVRMLAVDMPGVFASITAKLGEENVSMDLVMQKRRLDENNAEIVMITHEVNHADMQRALEEIAALPCVARIYSVIRVEDGEA